MADAFEDRVFGSGNGGDTSSAAATPAPVPDPFESKVFAPSIPAPMGAPAQAAAPTMLGSLWAGGKQGIRDVGNTLTKFSDWVDNKVPALKALDVADGLDPTPQVARDKAATAAFEVSPEGKSDSGQWGRFGGQVLATAPFLGAVPKVGSGVLGAGVTGAIQGAGAAALTSSTSDEPVWKQAAMGAGLGGAVGAGAGALSNYLLPVVDPAVANMAQYAKNKFGIQLLPSQLSTEGATGGSVEQIKDFTKKVTDAVGMKDNVITPDTVSAHLNRVGQDMDTLMGQHSLVADPPFVQKLGGIYSDAMNDFQPSVTLGPGGKVVSTTDTAERSRIKSLFQRINGAIDPATGEIDGPTLQALADSRSALAKDARSKVSGTSYVSSQILDALREQFEANAGADAGKWSQLRQQYQAGLALQKPAVAAGPTGVINPQGLQAALKPGRNYGDLSDLAQIGRYLPAPNASGGMKSSSLMDHIRPPLVAGGLDFLAHSDPHEAILTSLGVQTAQSVGNVVRRELQSSPWVANQLIQKSLGRGNAIDALGAVAPGAAAELYDEPKVRSTFQP